jgi:N-acetylglucosaminylphosphatidylinositol deacetylase
MILYSTSSTDSKEMGQGVTASRISSVLRSRGLRRLLLTRVLPIVLIVPLLLQVLLADIIGGDPRLFPPSLRRAKNLLIVTAHPDDECLFFSPSILGVLSGNPDIVGGLIVLSTGWFYGCLSHDMSSDARRE